MFILVENAEILAPKPLGRGSVLLVDRKIAKIARSGGLRAAEIDKLGIELEVIDAKGHYLVPGLIDPHEHLLGGSGESGFASQTPEIAMSELIRGGITTVVGCLGVDSRMKTMAGLLAKAKAFNEEGMTAFILSGGYNVPPTSIMQSLRDDLLFIAEVVGAGEIAISDERCLEASPRELARIASDAHIGGMLSQKAGITHFHVGDGKRRLELLRSLIDEHEVKPEWLYPTHVGRSARLFGEALELTRRGTTIDIDVQEKGLPGLLERYFEDGCDPAKLTLSSDAAIASPELLLERLAECSTRKKLSFQKLLPLVTENPARVLKLESKGSLREGADADVLVLDRKSLTPRTVIAKGKILMSGGKLRFKERFLQQSDRRIDLVGQKAA